MKKFFLLTFGWCVGWVRGDWAHFTVVKKWLSKNHTDQQSPKKIKHEREQSDTRTNLAQSQHPKNHLKYRNIKADNKVIFFIFIEPN